MTNLKNKYKEINPKITIKNIQKFFTDRKCLIKIEKLYHTNVNTYWCRLILYYSNTEILSANGKGTNKYYCLASGYAELYERFCCQNLFFNNSLLTTQYFNLYNPEGWISINEFLKDINANDFYNKFFNNIQDFKLYLLSFLNMQNEQIPAHMFTNLFDNKEKRLFNLSFIQRAAASNGLAAGNTIEEALVQGISEWCERYVIYQTVIHYQNQQTFYNIKKECLAQNLQDIINKIEKKGNKVFLLDLSYNYKMPVCAVIKIDLSTCRYYYTYGAAPVFEIAAERCLTEMYQGLPDERWTSSTSYGLQVPFLNLQTQSYTIMHDALCSTVTRDFCPFEFLNFTEVKTPSTIYYSNNIDCTNNILLNYYKILLKKLNIELYYKDISMSHDIKTIRIYSPNTNIYSNNFLNFSINEIKKKEYLLIAVQLFNLLNKILNNCEFLDIYEDLTILIYKIQNLTEKEYIILETMLMAEHLWIYPLACSFPTSRLKYIVQFINAEKFDRKEIFNFISKNTMVYFTIYNYLKNDYSVEQIQQIMLNFNINISLEEIKKCCLKEYVIYQTFLNEFKIRYCNGFIEKYLNMLLN